MWRLDLSFGQKQACHKWILARASRHAKCTMGGGEFVSAYILLIFGQVQMRVDSRVQSDPLTRLDKPRELVYEPTKVG